MPLAVAELERHLAQALERCQGAGGVDSPTLCILLLTKYVDRFKEVLSTFVKLSPSPENEAPTSDAAAPPAFASPSSGTHSVASPSAPAPVAAANPAPSAFERSSAHSSSASIPIMATASAGNLLDRPPTPPTRSWANVIGTRAATATPMVMVSTTLHLLKTPVNKDYLREKQAKAQILRREHLTEKSNTLSKNAKLEAIQKFKAAENLNRHTRKRSILEKQEKAETLRESLRSLPRAKVPVWPELSPIRSLTALSMKSDATDGASTAAAAGSVLGFGEGDEEHGVLSLPLTSVHEHKEKRMDVAALQEAALERRRQQEKERQEKLVREEERRRELELKQRQARMEKEAQALAAKADKLARLQMQKDMVQEKEQVLKREMEERIESTLKRKDEQTAKVKEKAAATNKNALMVVSRLQAARLSPEPRAAAATNGAGGGDGEADTHDVHPGTRSEPSRPTSVPPPPPPVPVAPPTAAFVKRFKKLRSKILAHTSDYTYVHLVPKEQLDQLFPTTPFAMRAAERLELAFTQMHVERKLPKKWSRMELELGQLMAHLHAMRVAEERTPASTPAPSAAVLAIKSHLASSGLVVAVVKACGVFDEQQVPLVAPRMMTQSLQLVLEACRVPQLGEFVLRSPEMLGLDLIHLLEGMLPFCTLDAHLFLEATAVVMAILGCCLQFPPRPPVMVASSASTAASLSRTTDRGRQQLEREILLKAQDDHVSMLLHSHVVERLRSFFFLAHGPLADGPLATFLLRATQLLERVTAFRSPVVLPVFANKAIPAVITTTMTCFAPVVASARATELFGMVTMLDSLVMYLPPILLGGVGGGGMAATGWSAPAPPLARSVVEIALVVLRTLNQVAHLDLRMFQEIVALEGMQLQFYHLLAFWLKYWLKFGDGSELLDAVLSELLLLLGNVSLDSPKNKEMLRYGQSPNLLQLLTSHMQLDFFVGRPSSNVLPVLAIAIKGDPDNQFVVEEEMSLDHLVLYLEEAKEQQARAAAAAEALTAANGASAQGARTGSSGLAATIHRRERREEPRFTLALRMPQEQWAECCAQCQGLEMEEVAGSCPSS